MGWFYCRMVWDDGGVIVMDITPPYQPYPIHISIHINHKTTTPQDILQDAIDSGLSCLAGLPYFEGDFWPTILEEMVGEVRLREEEENDDNAGGGDVAMIMAEQPSPLSAGSLSKPSSSSSSSSDKRKPPKKNSKKRPKNRVPPPLPPHSDLLCKLMNNMEKYKEVCGGFG